MEWLKPARFSSAVLTLFAIATGAMIAGTYLGTKDRIEQQERIAQAKALLQIFPEGTHDNLMVDDFIMVQDTDYLNLSDESKVYIARTEGEVVGMIVPSIAPDGYSGNISLITGIRADGSVAGVRILTHAETPGLGDKVELKKSDWVLSFNDKSLIAPVYEEWAVVKDGGIFDQFTGATITPRAVIKSVVKTLEYYEAQQTQLLQLANAPTPEPEQPNE